MNTELIIFEYFTSQNKLNLNSSKIFIEALNLVNSIAKSLVKDANVKKIHLIGNNKLEGFIKNKKIFYHPLQKINAVFDSLKKSKKQAKMILIAPETNKIYINLAKRFRRRISLLNSDIKTIKMISSKIKTHDFLVKNKIPCIAIEKTNKSCSSKLLKKPEYGAGSEEIEFVNKIKKKRGFFFQKFYPDEKGSFTMVCKNGEFIVLSCNKQCVEENKDSIRQVGLIIGGLEKYRDEIKVLANLISKSLPGLFGFIGVDIIRVKKSWKVLEINARFTSAHVGLQIAYGVGVKKIINGFYTKENLIKRTPKLLKKKYTYFDKC